VSSPPKYTRPPVFGFTVLPFAAAVGYVTIAAPYWLAARGVSLSAIGVMSGTSLAPHAIKFLWAPLLDVGGRRRLWFVLTTLLAGLCIGLVALLPAPEAHLGAFTALALLANIFATTSCAAADGLMAVSTAPSHKGRAAAWRMAGNVGGTGVLGAFALWLAARTSVPIAGLALTLVCAASALAALAIEEPTSSVPAQPAFSPREALAEIGRDVWITVKSQDGWTGIVICALPLGAGAMTNLFSAVGPEYGASEGRVAFVNGLGGGLIGAAGSFVGGWLADRMNRRLAYALSGGLTAASAVAMLLAARSPLTYTWGTLAYNFTNGIAFAALAAFVLEMVGRSVAAATKYTLFIAVANLAGSYVTALDGWASDFRKVGARGSLAADALLTFAGIVVLLVMVRFTRRDRSVAVTAAPVA
jgi:MFS transporter, PAT family, beta-lactamase induction signal transducer AmpG